MKSSARSYLLTLLLYVSFINEIGLRAVYCQEEEGGYQCMPRKTLFNLLRLPEVTSNVAAYSRKYRNGVASLKGFITDDNLSPEVCLPVGLYSDLFGDPAIRGRLTAIGRAQKMFGDPTTRSYLPIDRIDYPRDELEEGEWESEASSSSEDYEKLNSEKRSIATLAKNGDLPISLQLHKTEENEDEEEKRSLATLVHDVRRSKLNPDELEALIRLTDYEKRNVASLARDYGLPNGKRNVAALARDFALPQTNSGKRNIASLARDFALPSGKRNVAALARDFSLPSGKRNIAALARDYSLPNGKRYLDIFSRGNAARHYDETNDNDGKTKGIGSFLRYGDLPLSYKRNLASLARDWSLPKQYRYGRSLPRLENRDNRGENRSNKTMITGSKINDDSTIDDDNNNNDEKKLEALASADSDDKNGKKDEIIDEKSIEKNNYDMVRRPKRQIEFSDDEYPLPVMQNTNVLDYEEMIEALTDGDYPNTEKRFMAAGERVEDMQEMREKEEPIFSGPVGKRHIGALARLGWLPSFRSSRFSRSPRYLVNRENSADGTSANYPTDPPSRTLGFSGRTTRYSHSQNLGDCRHGFKRFLLLPAVDKLLLHRLYTTPKTA